ARPCPRCLPAGRDRHFALLPRQSSLIAYARTWPAGISASRETFYSDVHLRKLGHTDLEISRVGVGTAPIGSRPGEWWVNWGHQDDADSARAIQAAVDGGINWVDTAPFYGWGHAEEVVGRALAGRDRKSVV